MDQLHYIKSTRCGYCRQKKEIWKSWALQSISETMQDRGYCNSSSITFQGDQLSLRRYEELMKEGWRRSGDFMYKPDLLRSCCRAYTIRTNYELYLEDGYYNKSAKKTMRKFYKSVGCTQNAISTELDDFYHAKEHGGDKGFFTVLLPNTFSYDKFELYKKYKFKVHGDKEEDVDELSFYNFLCLDPFRKEETEDLFDWRLLNKEWTSGQYGEELKKLQGPIHECYFADNKLIAVAVLDILPTSVSSVYFIWDPDYAHLGLGNVSAIREIMLTKVLEKEYYYLGFLIADCEKMIYKAKFGGEIRNFSKRGGDPLWVRLKHVSNQLEDGYFKVFDSEMNDIAEQQYGMDSDCYDSEFVSSFDVVSKTQLFPTPKVIP